MEYHAAALEQAVRAMSIKGKKEKEKLVVKVAEEKKKTDRMASKWQTEKKKAAADTKKTREATETAEVEINSMEATLAAAELHLHDSSRRHEDQVKNCVESTILAWPAVWINSASKPLARKNERTRTRTKTGARFPTPRSRICFVSFAFALATRGPFIGSQSPGFEREGAAARLGPFQLNVHTWRVHGDCVTSTPRTCLGSRALL
jgi:hypothetical protein